MTLLIWCIFAITALIFRFIGSWPGRRIGARHVIAWFGVHLGFSIALISLEILYGRHEIPVPNNEISIICRMHVIWLFLGINIQRSCSNIA